MRSNYSKPLLAAFHERLAETSITSSALRNQGPPKTIAKARQYMINEVKLPQFFKALRSRDRYEAFLDLHTDALQRALGKRESGSTWGAARKALNLFFRAVVYNKVLIDHYTAELRSTDYDTFISPLEVPLDRDSADGLKSRNNQLRRMKGIVHLTPDLSQRYQETAQLIADEKGYARVHLDMEYWRKMKKKK
jgi:hypothetical protein